MGKGLELRIWGRAKARFYFTYIPFYPYLSPLISPRSHYTPSPQEARKNKSNPSDSLMAENGARNGLPCKLRMRT